MFTSIAFNVCFLIWSVWLLVQAYSVGETVYADDIGGMTHRLHDWILNKAFVVFCIVFVFMYPAKVFYDQWGLFYGMIASVVVPTLAVYWIAYLVRPLIWIALPALWVWFCWFAS